MTQVSNAIASINVDAYLCLRDSSVYRILCFMTFSVPLKNSLYPVLEI